MKEMLLVFTLILVSLTGCGSGPDLSGTWKGDHSMDLQLFEDGSLILISDGLGGGWKILNDGRVKIEVAIPMMGNMTGVFSLQEADGKSMLINEQPYRGNLAAPQFSSTYTKQ